MTLKLAVLISGAGRTLQNLIDKIKQGELHANIEIVISSKPDVQGLERAEKNRIKTAVVEHKKFKDVMVFSNEITKHIDSVNPDLVVMAGFIHLWKIPKKYDGKVMNIHPALLPKFGGKGFYGFKVHEAVLQAGEKESGCTVHIANNSYDKGRIILQRKISILPNDTPQTLQERVYKEECIAYPEAIRLFAYGKVKIS